MGILSDQYSFESLMGKEMEHISTSKKKGLGYRLPCAPTN